MAMPLVMICCQTTLLAALLVGGGASTARAASEPRALRVAWRVAGEARGIPAVRGDLVYFLSRRHEVVAIDKERGDVRWTRPTGSGGSLTGGALIVATPAGVVTGDDGLVAFDEVGTWQWRFDAPDGGGPGFYLGGVVGETVFAGSSTGWVHAVDARSGITRWSADVTHDRGAAAFAPVAAGDDVVVGFAAGAAAGGIVLLEGQTGRERWRAVFSDGSPADRATGSGGGPLVIGSAVVAAATDGRIHVLDRTSGRGLWHWPAVDRRVMPIAAGVDYRPLARAGRVLVAGSLSGVITAYDLLTGRQRWQRLPHASSVAFGMTAGTRTVLVPHLAGPLVALDPDDGRERGRTQPADGQFGWAPAVSGALAFAASSSGYVAFYVPDR
ncbi:MAG: PQQ-binding-like beta-propeller repeat protein [Acidobacteria bacterium]|nr:PQQ-binding-like beta-propeller repeat protein [Acidobacteriota bacterium]